MSDAGSTAATSTPATSSTSGGPLDEIGTAIDPEKSFGKGKSLFRPTLAVILLIGLPALALYQARTFVTKF